MHHERRHAGFTLIEVILALALSGLAILGSLLLLDQLDDGSRRIVDTAARGTRQGIAERTVDRWLLDAVVPVDTMQALRGDTHSVDVSTLCDATAGWPEPCRISLAIAIRGDSSDLEATMPGASALRLRSVAGLAELRYRSVARTDSMWVPRWNARSTLPRAIALVTDRDTIVFPVSAR